METLNQHSNGTHTYRRLRKTIGILGVSLPIALVILSMVPFFETRIQPSISHFYYTNFRELFTGTLCAVGLFLIRYKGHGNSKFWKNDNLLTNIAGFMAFGVALIPTDPIEPGDKIHTLIPLHSTWLGALHYFFAAMLFITFSVLSVFVFTLGQAENKDIPKSVFNENNIYIACGTAIIVFIALVPVAAAWKFKYSTLLLEALSLFTFGFAWLIKGRALGDTGIVGKKLYREDNQRIQAAVKPVVGEPG